MTIKGTLVLALGIIALLLMAGCADVTTTQKVGDFGTVFGASSEEQKAIDWFKSTYGDPTTNAGQPARFIEPMVTTGLSDKNLPVDKVTVFPSGGGSVYFFVIYDNFAQGDPITVRWTYLENGKDVTRVQKAAGGDFGRFIVEFQKPDTGWGKGRQKITASGNGVSADAEFVIGDKLATMPLPYTPVTGKETTTTTRTTTAPATGAMTMPATTLTTAVTGQPTSGTITCEGDKPDLCNGVCTFLPSDDNNCGQCGNSCADFGTHCYDGECEEMPCPGNLWNCGERETSIYYCGIDIMTDPNHCGDCRRTCPRTNGEAGCTNGICTITCNAGWANADSDVTNGCEAPVATTTSHPTTVRTTSPYGHI